MSSESSTSNLQLAQVYLYRYVGPIFIIIGIVSCVLSLIVFTRKNLRKNTCSIYFIAFNIANLLFILVSLLSFTLEIGYNIAPALYSLFYCRFRLYFAFFFNILCPSYLLCASIDRVLITSFHARIRQISTLRLAYLTIAIQPLFYILILIVVIFVTNILQIEPNYFYCYIEPGEFTLILTYISILKEIFIPSLLIIFGFLSVRNIQAMRRVRIVPVSGSNRVIGGQNSNSMRSRDRQFVLMLIVDIVTYILFDFIMPCSLVYEQITKSQTSTIAQTQTVYLIKNIAIFSVHIPFCINCYTHIIVSKTFRNEIKNVLLWK
ncbi:unnamed protein product [Adineta steineri]|uniref:G-protein coupled receptors family 1 profile domain-containing protein n=1 Tax=Adineta steineri TaxID=433720 RepID=A0A814ZH49_9BILA|nr:unnamed protein product [Adineta steineri]